MNYRTRSSREPSQEELSCYLQDLATLPVFSPEEEQAMVQRIAIDPHSREADAARAQLISSNLRLVVGLARSYQPFGVELADLVQEGNLALIQVAQQFDPQRHPHFRPLAKRCVCLALYHITKEHQAYLSEHHLFKPDHEALSSLRTHVLQALVHHVIDGQTPIFGSVEEDAVSLQLGKEHHL